MVWVSCCLVVTNLAENWDWLMSWIFNRPLNPNQPAARHRAHRLIDYP
jgi:hypothetical protein